MSKLTDAEVAEMLAKLKAHFHEPVMPVSEYCSAIKTWFRAIEALNNGDDTKNPESRQGHTYWRFLRSIEIDIRKSNLLYRMIYHGDPLRSEKCPEHQGHWDGQAQMLLGCTYGCGGTGWLLLPEQKWERIVFLQEHLKSTFDDLVTLVQEVPPECMPDPNRRGRSWEVPSDNARYEFLKRYRLACEWLTLTGNVDLVPEVCRG